MAGQSIIPIQLELTEGTFYTLWAPTWNEGNAQWQAVLGLGDDVYLFDSLEKLLAFVRSDQPHDLTEHPGWGRFINSLPESIVVEPKHVYDIIGVPEALAGKVTYDNVATVDRCFSISRSLANIADLTDTRRMFAANSILGVIENGSEHFHGAGQGQWSAIGRVVLANWDNAVDELDTLTGKAPELSDQAVESAASDLDEAKEAVAARRAQALKDREAEKEKEAAPDSGYAATPWAEAGIDPIKIAINGRTLYTLRCYLGGRPLFLGQHGTINTFSQPRTMVRWLIENNEHDLAGLATWDNLVTAANAGELEVEVHEENVYSFTGLVDDIKEGPKAIDTKQLARAYELLADAADWAGDDAVNEVLAGNQQLQWLLNYLLDTGENSEPVPPFEEEARGWNALEAGLTDRFTTKV